MIHVYAFATAAATQPGLVGLDDAGVECLDIGGVTVFVSRHTRSPGITDDAVVRHAEVVDAVMRSAGAVLPARFGLAYADEAALRRAVENRADELEEQLRRVHGCVELGLRVLAPEQAPQPLHASGGADYLRARLRETNERTRLADDLHESLRVLARDATHRAPPSGRLLLSAAYLVSADVCGEFEEQVRELQRDHRELALVCTGPWPPYSFATRAGAVA